MTTIQADKKNGKEPSCTVLSMLCDIAIPESIGQYLVKIIMILHIAQQSHTWAYTPHAHIPCCDICTDIHQDILAIAEKWRQLGCPLLVKDYVKYSALIS